MTSGTRLESLDAFRGITVTAMILVSTPGTWEAVYWPLQHAAWNGWTPTDLVFPFFVFAMGAAVPIALQRRRGQPRRLRRHVGRRALTLAGLGLLLNVIQAPAPLDWSTFRLPGVLQRLAIVYVVVAWLAERTSRAFQIGVAIALLVGYWAIMMLVPVPGVGAGVLTPDGNLTAFLDRLLLGRHLAFGTWDSEGLLSTIPAIATALCGVFAADWLITHAGRRHHAVELMAAGAAATIVALVWSVWFPINKSIWTSSFALLSSGVAVMLLAACHWVLDVRRWRVWSLPFVALGRNALAVYVLSIAIDTLMTRWTIGSPAVSIKWDLYSHGFALWLGRCCSMEMASLSYAIAYVTIWTLVATVMYRHRVFVGI